VKERISAQILAALTSVINDRIDWCGWECFEWNCGDIFKADASWCIIMNYLNLVYFSSE